MPVYTNIAPRGTYVNVGGGLGAQDPRQRSPPGSPRCPRTSARLIAAQVSPGAGASAIGPTSPSASGH